MKPDKLWYYNVCYLKKEEEKNQIGKKKIKYSKKKEFIKDLRSPGGPTFKLLKVVLGSHF